jgi:hypothetical protein
MYGLQLDASGNLKVGGTALSNLSSKLTWTPTDLYPQYNRMDVSQRIANQDIYFGYEDNSLVAIQGFARFHFTGTDNTKVVTETAWNPITTPSASETETNTVVLPAGAVTSSSNVYRILMAQDRVIFSVNGTIVASHTKRIPHIRRTSNIGFSTIDLRILNGTTPATNTNVVMDYITGRVYNRLDVWQTQPGDSTNLQQVAIAPAITDNGLLSVKTVCAASTNATVVKGSAGKLYQVDCFNSDSIGYWVKFYNKATAPTVGTDVPVATRWVPAGGGYVLPGDIGTPFSAGIGFATTLLATDADTTVVTNANKLVVNLKYI